jgi:hypothetical protein
MGLVLGLLGVTIVGLVTAVAVTGSSSSGPKPRDEAASYWSDGLGEGPLKDDTTYTDVHGRVWSYGPVGYMHSGDLSISIMGLTSRSQIETKADGAKKGMIAGHGDEPVAKAHAGNVAGFVSTTGSSWWWQRYQSHVPPRRS